MTPTAKTTIKDNRNRRLTDPAPEYAYRYELRPRGIPDLNLHLSKTKGSINHDISQSESVMDAPEYDIPERNFQEQNGGEVVISGYKMKA